MYTENIKILSNSPCHHLYGAVTCIKRSPFSCPVIENFTPEDTKEVIRRYKRGNQKTLKG